MRDRAISALTACWLLMAAACADGVEEPDVPDVPEPTHRLMLASPDSVGALLFVIVGDGVEQLILHSDRYVVYAAVSEPGYLSVVIAGQIMEPGPILDVVAPGWVLADSLDLAFGQAVDVRNDEIPIDRQSLTLVPAQ